ncbi:MAG TPA: restriction endonuclease [Casimicrobium huifangae]|jgi:restriction system protein|uniref:restriction endonuclease n=1 Tax=Casimicrobium huifangae TaxID=2591109 RepID=UPI0013969F6D|nr:restriction endonuclease [Casimicrobium huifangae]HOB00918.1 restriction endonuclease [Casimicrobium huifangae]HQA34869.1 restriction endonuclease [Casimicrobium huifangae]HQD65421.1 restriction endonuclease [Casimicrobium huifangae]
MNPAAQPATGFFASADLWLLVVVGLLLVIAILLLVNTLQRRRQLQRAAEVSPNPMLVPLNRLTWQQFELLVSQAFRHRGYLVGSEGKRAPDGASNMVLRKSGEYFLVHCLEWRSPSIEVTTARELHNQVRARHAAGGFIVTTGQFTRETLAFASGRNLQLIDGATLREMLNDTAGLPTGVPTTIITIGQPSEAPPVAAHR